MRERVSWTLYSIKHIHDMVNITVYVIINDKNWQKAENNMANFKVQHVITISMLLSVILLVFIFVLEGSSVVLRERKNTNNSIPCTCVCSEPP